MSNLNVTESTVLVQILTCAKSPEERLAHSQNQLNQHLKGLPAQFVMGYVADDPIVSHIYDERQNKRKLKRELTQTEIAVYAGHRKAMQNFLDSNFSASLILEDDFLFSDPELVRLCIQEAGAILVEGRNLIKLFDFLSAHHKAAAIYETEVRGVSLVKHKSPSAGMAAYLISREGAQRFLARPKIFRMIDEDIKYFWELGLEIWSVPNNPIAETSTSLGNSLIEVGRAQQKKQKSLARSLFGNLLTAHRKICAFIEARKFSRAINRQR